jgi:hypothetical protein
MQQMTSSKVPKDAFSGTGAAICNKKTPKFVLRQDLGWCARVGSGQVSVYKVYVLGRDRRVAAPPHVIECDDDEEAIRQARQHVVGTVVEVWRDLTLVARFEPE